MRKQLTKEQRKYSPELREEAFKKAWHRREPLPGCIHHSDRGSQYCSYKYQQEMKDAGFLVSMSGKGNCYDNAPTESLWGTIKQELIFQQRFKSRSKAVMAIEVRLKNICLLLSVQVMKNGATSAPSNGLTVTILQ